MKNKEQYNQYVYIVVYQQICMGWILHEIRMKTKSYVALKKIEEWQKGKIQLHISRTNQR